MKATLEDNYISPHKLYDALNTYKVTLDQFLEVSDSREFDAEYLMAKEIVNETEAFMNILEICNRLTRNK